MGFVIIRLIQYAYLLVFVFVEHLELTVHLDTQKLIQYFDSTRNFLNLTRGSIFLASSHEVYRQLDSQESNSFILKIRDKNTKTKETVLRFKQEPGTEH